MPATIRTMAAIPTAGRRYPLEDAGCVVVWVVDWVVDWVVVVDETGPSWKKLAGSMSVGRGAWLKSNMDIMSFTWVSLVPRVGRLNTVSANLSIEANSYWVLSM